jgi:hypothetical protein
MSGNPRVGRFFATLFSADVKLCGRCHTWVETLVDCTREVNKIRWAEMKDKKEMQKESGKKIESKRKIPELFMHTSLLAIFAGQAKAARH